MSNVADSLNGLLADGTVFYQKLRHYHWNVRGKHFLALHEKLEEVYDRWAEFNDQVAERVVALDAIPLHTLKSVLEHASLQEDETLPGEEAIVQNTVSDMETLRGRVDEIIAQAEEAGDRTTANLLDDIRDGIEDDRWMLQQVLR